MNSTVALFTADEDEILIAWSTAFTRTSLANSRLAELLSKDQIVGNSAVYAGSDIGRDSPLKEADSPSSSCATYWLTRSIGREATEPFCVALPLLTALPLLLVDFWVGSQSASIRSDVSSQKIRLSSCTVCSIWKLVSEPVLGKE